MNGDFRKYFSFPLSVLINNTVEIRDRGSRGISTQRVFPGENHGKRRDYEGKTWHSKTGRRREEELLVLVRQSNNVL